MDIQATVDVLAPYRKLGSIEKRRKSKRGGVKEEGSGDSEQDVVTSAKITAEPIRLQQSYD